MFDQLAEYTITTNIIYIHSKYPNFELENEIFITFYFKILFIFIM